mmetsp:Transcript_49188/g.116781  ORF Transcript_49188/g.116781 Transcript_49188/m.116781 type:complete len:207 (-) Transcript_49188:752-1372(-)
MASSSSAYANSPSTHPSGSATASPASRSAHVTSQSPAHCASPRAERAGPSSETTQASGRGSLVQFSAQRQFSALKPGAARSTAPAAGLASLPDNAVRARLALDTAHTRHARTHARTHTHTHTQEARGCLLINHPAERLQLEVLSPTVGSLCGAGTRGTKAPSRALQLQPRSGCCSLPWRRNDGCLPASTLPVPAHSPASRPAIGLP